MTERAIFLAALDRTDPADRAAYLDQACAGDAELRQRVNDLLAAHAESDSFLEPPAEIGDATAPVGAEGSHLTPITEGPGTRIGPYKLLQQIGEGGMGVVYIAEQETPVRRKVALKIIKPGKDTKQVVSRFEAERQALALMDHPNIARVLDAGTTASGRPYFVMDLVRGIPITLYCDEARLSPRERLELFIPVCQAIQHAHQKGIIHRDVKPSNVLVTLHDGSPVPKIMPYVNQAYANDAIAKGGTQVADATIYRCLSDTSLVRPYIDPATGQVDGITNRTSYLMNSLLSHKTIRYGRWTLPRFQQDIGTSQFVAFNERDAAVMDTHTNDPVAATDPRQDDYDIWLGTQTLDVWIPWNRHGTSNVLYLDGHARSIAKRDAYLGMYPGAQVLTVPSFYP